MAVLTVGSAALGNASGEPRDALGRFVKAQGYTFPILFHADGAVWRTYQQAGIPANYIIDGRGDMQLLLSGAFRSEENIWAALKAVRRADGQ